MPYLNLDLDYFSHPKVIRLTGLLGSDAALLPIRLWVHAGKYHPERGMLQGYSKHELESAMAWTGEKGVCVDAMLKVGLIEEIADGFRIHDWTEHAGHLSAFKKRAKTAAKKRWAKYASSTAKHKTTNAPNLSSPNLAVPVLKEERDIPTVQDVQAVLPEARTVKLSGKRQALEDFTVTESLRVWAREKHGVEIPDEVLGEFKDHWRKEPDRKLRTDWVATFQMNVNKLVGWGALKPITGHRLPNSPMSQKCQERVQRGNFLKPCGEPSITMIGGRPLCQQHKEHHEHRQHASSATA